MTIRWTTIVGGCLTALIVAFLVTPAIMSIVAGLSVNYAKGLSSGLTLNWVIQVWALYSDTILRSILVALATLALTLLIGVPGAYALVRQGGRQIGRAHV